MLDTFADYCPSCGEECSMPSRLRPRPAGLTFRNGQRVPGASLTEHTLELGPCSKCGGEVFAVLIGAIFMGFASTNDYPIFHSDHPHLEATEGEERGPVPAPEKPATLPARILCALRRLREQRVGTRDAVETAIDNSKKGGRW